MKSITAKELKSWIQEDKKFFLLDVREEWEHAAYNIGGTNIPLGDVMMHKNELPANVPVIVYCEKGIRSAIVIQRLEPYGFKDIYNLEGGMSAWRKEE